MNRLSIFPLARNALSYHEGWQKQWRSPEPKREYDALIVGGDHSSATVETAAFTPAIESAGREMGNCFSVTLSAQMA